MTLLELLIALAVFALMSVMAYGGLSTVLTTAEVTRSRAADLTRLQQTLLRLGSDTAQWLDRASRDPYGDSQPPLDAPGSGSFSLTRSGWSNPLQRPRSTLQRVGYRLDDGQLLREGWRVLDRAQDSEPYTATLLEGVEAMRYRILDDRRNWHDSWPLAAEESPLRPIALELTLELERWGTVVRLLPLGGGG